MSREPYEEPWRENDSSRKGTVWTTRLKDTTGVLRCYCGSPVDVLWEELGMVHGPPHIRRCADCRGDQRVLNIINPPAEIVAQRRAERFAAAKAAEAVKAPA